MPGNTADWNFLLKSSGWPLVRMMPPRGPRRVLCVVLVTTWACGSGLGYSPAATRPATCAMSTQKDAPTLSAIRSEEQTSELQSLIRISTAVLCLRKKNTNHIKYTDQNTKQYRP